MDPGRLIITRADCTFSALCVSISVCWYVFLQEKKGPSTDKEHFETHLRGDESKFINSMI